VSGDTLAIHTSTYVLRPYDQSFTVLERAIELSGLDVRGLMTRTEFSHNGARCFRSYLFPAIGVDLGNEDKISLQILALDSYDGTYSSSVASGGWRHICLNGCLFGRTIEQLKVRHVEGGAQRYQNAVDKVVLAAEAFVNMEPRIKRWREVELFPSDLKKLLEEMPQITDRLRDHFVSRFVTEAEEQTLYGLWNVLTAWATRDGGSAQSRVDRDRRVAAMVESRGWRYLER
jgi:hypothetical protein